MISCSLLLQLLTSPLNPTAASSTTPHPTRQSSLSSNAPTSRKAKHFETQLHDMERQISQNMQELHRSLHPQSSDHHQHTTPKDSPSTSASRSSPHSRHSPSQLHLMLTHHVYTGREGSTVSTQGKHLLLLNLVNLITITTFRCLRCS